MTLQQHPRGFRALTTMLACAALALAPAAAIAKPKHGHVRKPAATKTATRPSATGLGDRLGLGPTAQLAAMRTAIAAAPLYFAGLANGCVSVTPLLTAVPGPTIAGNFRDAATNCYVRPSTRWAT